MVEGLLELGVDDPLGFQSWLEAMDWSHQSRPWIEISGRNTKFRCQECSMKASKYCIFMAGGWGRRDTEIDDSHGWIVLGSFSAFIVVWFSM